MFFKNLGVISTFQFFFAILNSKSSFILAWKIFKFTSMQDFPKVEFLKKKILLNLLLVQVVWRFFGWSPFDHGFLICVFLCLKSGLTFPVASGWGCYERPTQTEEALASALNGGQTLLLLLLLKSAQQEKRTKK